MVEIKTIQELRHLSRSEIVLNGKSFVTPFAMFTPRTKPDKDAICEIMFKGTPDRSFTDFMGALSYRIFEHDTITRNIGNNITNKDTNNAFLHLNQTRFKLIEMSMDSIRSGYRGYFDGYLALENIPQEFRQYIIDVRNKTGSLHDLSLDFWQNLLRKSKTVYFENWADKIQAKRSSDVFVPAVPHITSVGRNELTSIAIEVNEDVQEFVQRDSAIVFSLDAAVFQHRKVIMKILDAISELQKSKLCMFKIKELPKIRYPHSKLWGITRIFASHRQF